MAHTSLFFILLLFLLLLSLSVYAGTFRGHNHFGDRGSGHYERGILWGTTNSGKTIEGTYDNEMMSGTDGRYSFSGTYGSGFFSGTVFGYEHPFVHGTYFN